MATTYLQVLNRVLERIGEDQLDVGTGSLTSVYHKLVGSMVNDIKEQIEDAHNWRALRQTVTVSVTASSQSATISEADERSRLIRIYQAQLNRSVPLVWDTTDSSNPIPLQEIDLSELIYRDTQDPNNDQDPIFFALDNSSGNVLKLFVFPRPSDTRTIQISLIIPQIFLESDALSTQIKIPVRPLIAGATWYALEERGEELGTNGSFNERRFNDALNSAISRDDAEQGNVAELIAV